MTLAAIVTTDPIVAAARALLRRGDDGGSQPGRGRDVLYHPRGAVQAGGVAVSELHLCKNAKARKGQVFEATLDGDSWHRKPLAEADPERIILCCKRGCINPAVVLDHIWPHDSFYNRCAEHIECDPR